jgi:hypothetical protein
LSKPLPGKRVEIDPETETFSMFKDKCSETLGIKAEKIFNIYG